MAWRSAKMKAWIAGVVVGLIGAVVASGIGFVAGVCCLFQFANIIVPLGAGLVAGPLGAFMADWSAIPGEEAVGAGAGLGLRAGGLAAALSGGIGFLATLLVPLLSQVFVAMNSGDDVAATVMSMVAGMLMSALFAALFAGVGTVLGVLLGAAGGAGVGAMRRQ